MCDMTTPNSNNTSIHARVLYTENIYRERLIFLIYWSRQLIRFRPDLTVISDYTW